MILGFTCKLQRMLGASKVTGQLPSGGPTHFEVAPHALAI